MLETTMLHAITKTMFVGKRNAVMTVIQIHNSKTNDRGPTAVTKQSEQNMVPMVLLHFIKQSKETIDLASKHGSRQEPNSTEKAKTLQQHSPCLLR